MLDLSAFDEWPADVDLLRPWTWPLELLLDASESLEEAYSDAGNEAERLVVGCLLRPVQAVVRDRARDMQTRFAQEAMHSLTELLNEVMDKPKIEKPEKPHRFEGPS